MENLFLVLMGAALVLVFGYLRSRMWSFVAQRPEDYADASDRFDLRQHLNGPILCEGVIYGPLGRVTSRFVGEFDVRWTGDTGIMREHFKYDSGATQDREWKLLLTPDGLVEATADDVEGTGRGRQMGAALQLKYRLRLPDESGGHVLDANDWMYLAPNGTIVNRSQFRKFGIQVAELVATLRPDERRANLQDAA